MMDHVPPLQGEFLKTVHHHCLLSVPSKGGERYSFILRLLHPGEDLLRADFRQCVRILAQRTELTLNSRPDAPAHDFSITVRGRVRRRGAPVEHQRRMAMQTDRAGERREAIRPHGVVPPLVLLEEIVPLQHEETTRDRLPYPGEESLLAAVGADDVDGNSRHGARFRLLTGVLGTGVLALAEYVVVRLVGEVLAQDRDRVLEFYIFFVQMGGPGVK